jgi:hypothetical protein
MVGRLLQTFMLSIVFNSTLVYEAGAIRWFGILIFAALALAWIASRRSRRRGAFSARPVCAS